MGGQTTASFVKHSISSISTDATLTGGTITDTGTIGINLSNPNTWAAAQNFTGGLQKNGKNVPDVDDLASERTTANDEFVKNMLHLGYYDTYTKDANGNYVVTRQTGYINASKYINSIQDNGQVTSGLYRYNIFPIEPGLVTGADFISNYHRDRSITTTTISPSIDVHDSFIEYIFVSTESTLAGFQSYLLSHPCYIQFKLSASYSETYDPLHFARIQPYALEHAKKEADRSSNLLDYSRLDPSVATYSGSTINVLSTSMYNKSMFNGDVVGNDGVPSDYSKLIKVKRGTYTLSATNTGGYDIALQAWTLTGTRLSNSSFSNNGQASVSVSQDCYLDIRRYPPYTAFSITNLMLVEGSHPLPYQPYEGPVTHDGSLAAVAKSGEYSDLKDKPALFSGSYNDLTNKPTIPSAVTVDDALSDTSTNPVQNKVIKAALDGKQDTLTFDTTPTESSANPVSSGGVYSALNPSMKRMQVSNLTIFEARKAKSIEYSADDDNQYKCMYDYTPGGVVLYYIDIYGQPYIISGTKYVYVFD